MFNMFFSIIDTRLSCEDSPTKIVRWCPDGEFLAIFGSCICSELHADLNSKFALGPHHV